MHIVFDSMTGNVRRFSHALRDMCGVSAFDLKWLEPERVMSDDPFLLVTYTFGRGDVPASTEGFLEQHAAGLRGVVASGSFHWGATFALAGERIAARYRVPLVAKINKSGSEADRQRVKCWLEENRGFLARA